MKQNFYKITAANRFQAVIQFLRKELGWKATDPLVRRDKMSFVAKSDLFSLHTSIWHSRLPLMIP